MGDSSQTASGSRHYRTPASLVRRRTRRMFPFFRIDHQPLLGKQGVGRRHSLLLTRTSASFAPGKLSPRGYATR